MNIKLIKNFELGPGYIIPAGKVIDMHPNEGMDIIMQGIGEATDQLPDDQLPEVFIHVEIKDFDEEVFEDTEWKEPVKPKKKK